MVTDYVYDSNGIMTDILHKSGSTVKQGFSYLYDDVYNIEQVTHEDGSYWTYGYDNRYRLTSAVRHNAGDTIQASYAYAYDAGENMTSKTEPWVDDFNDGSLSGDWNGSSATDWPVTAGEARNVVGGSNRLMWKTNTDASNELRFRYVNYDTGSAAKNLFASGRYNSADDRVGVLLRPDCLILQQYVAATNTWTTLDSDLTATSTQGQHYDIRMEMNGATAKVWRDGALVLESTAATVTTTDTVRLQASANASFGVDNVMFLAGSLSRTTTMTHRANNEIDQVTDYNGTASYTFDAWGRTSTEAKNGVTRTYSWTSANLLAGIDSSDTNETDVGYFYTGDLKRIWRMENASLNNIYTWGAGFNVMSESVVGNPLKTFVPGLAEVIGNDLNTSGDYRYLTSDHLGSTRGMWNSSVVPIGNWEFTPYGAVFNISGAVDVTQLYTGHDLDKVTGQYYAPFRTLQPSLGRWLSRDPLHMIDGPNMFTYVTNDPINFWDPYGLYLDLIIEIPLLAYDLYNGNYSDAGITVACMFIPGVPGGLSKIDDIAKLGKHADDAGGVGKEISEQAGKGSGPGGAKKQTKKSGKETASDVPTYARNNPPKPGDTIEGYFEELGIDKSHPDYTKIKKWLERKHNLKRR